MGGKSFRRSWSVDEIERVLDDDEEEDGKKTRKKTKSLFDSGEKLHEEVGNE